MTTPQPVHEPRLVLPPATTPRLVSDGNSPLSDIEPTGHADGGTFFFHVPGHANDEASALGVGHAQFSRSPVERGNRLMNFAETVLESAILAERASEDLLNRCCHLLASLQAKETTDRGHQHAERAQGLSDDVFA